jgi:hypothetical protein
MRSRNDCYFLALFVLLLLYFITKLLENLAKALPLQHLNWLSDSNQELPTTRRCSSCCDLWRLRIATTKTGSLIILRSFISTSGIRGGVMASHTFG